MGQKKLGLGLLVSGLAFGAVACGGGGSPATGFSSVESLQNAMAAPTGTVSAESAMGVAAAFEDSSSTELPAGIRQKAQAQSASGSEPCTEGGSISYSASETMVQMKFNGCGEGGCVTNGTYNMLIDSATETSVSSCFSFDATVTCPAEGSVNAQFSGCMDIDSTAGSFEFIYLIEYEGETYTVSGNYSSGAGTLTITGANGSFTCDYAGETGSCTSSTGEAFEFSSSSSQSVEG